MNNQTSYRIKTLRTNLGLSQESFGAKLNIPGHQISKYERGEITPASSALLKLNEAYNVNLNWLLTGTGEMFIEHDRQSIFPSEITSIESLTDIASVLHNVYKDNRFTKSATASWIHNLIKTLNILSKEWRSASQGPQGRKFLRRTEKTDTVSHYLSVHFPGDQNLSIEDRIEKALEKTGKAKRVDALYASDVSRCVEKASRDLSFLEHSGKYQMPGNILAEIKSLVEPWSFWVVQAGSKKGTPLEIDPELIGKLLLMPKQNIGEVKEKKGVVEVGLIMSDGLFYFSIFDGEVKADCSADIFYELVQAIDITQGVVPESYLGDEVRRKFEENGSVEVGSWEIRKSYGEYSIKNIAGRIRVLFPMDAEQFGQFIELVGKLWQRDDVKYAVVKQVLTTCGAL
jgi:transcriptional regulator with XRE-family HTH domain